MMNCGNAKGFAKHDKIKQFLDQGPTVFVSFGSLCQIHKLPKEKLDVLLNVFEKLKPLNVLWKFEKPDTLKNIMPSNVMAVKWVPQLDVLNHPNVKVFVTHGGVSSFQESICFKKPIVSIHFLP